MNRNLYVDTESQRIITFFDHGYCLRVSIPNSRHENTFDFEVFESSQYGDEDVYASFQMASKRIVRQSECDVILRDLRRSLVFTVHVTQNHACVEFTVDKKWFDIKWE